MGQTQSESPASSSCFQRVFWIVVALLALFFLLRLLGVKPLEKTTEEEWIEHPHR